MENQLILAGAAPLVKTIAKVGTIAATAGAAKFGLLGKLALKKSGSGASDSNNLTSTSSDQIPTTISDKVDKSNNLNSNNSAYLSENSTISGLNNPPNSSTSSLDSSNDIVKISNLKTPPKSYRQTEVLAKDNNVDLSTITGLKKDGRVLKSDVQNAINDQKSLNTLNAASSNNILDTATKVDKLLNDKNNDQSLLKNKSTKDDLIKQKDNKQIKKRSISRQKTWRC
ncbi:E3 binding domain-containing protein [Mycoplasma feriruminatoris]|uniref:E3 binding domain-containing protein n=1 Tax=Mycoplasma feriruminatoris TaxID=1179777 RepID=UPI0039EA57AE